MTHYAYGVAPVDVAKIDEALSAAAWPFVNGEDGKLVAEHVEIVRAAIKAKIDTTKHARVSISHSGEVNPNPRAQTGPTCECLTLTITFSDPGPPPPSPQEVDRLAELERKVLDLEAAQEG